MKLLARHIIFLVLIFTACPSYSQDTTITGVYVYRFYGKNKLENNYKLILLTDSSFECQYEGTIGPPYSNIGTYQVKKNILILNNKYRMYPKDKSEVSYASKGWKSEERFLIKAGKVCKIKAGKNEVEYCYLKYP